MIFIVKTMEGFTRKCQCCCSDDNVKEIAFRSNNQGIVVALCEKCRNELIDVIVDDMNKDKEEGEPK